MCGQGKHTDSCKLAISKAKKGQPGKPHTEETKSKMSQIKSEHYDKIGRKTHAEKREVWNGWYARSQDDPVKRSKRNAKLNAYMKVWGKQARAKLKADILAAYGGKCVCCGETIEQFLTMDHIIPRSKTKESRSHFYIQIKKQGFPKDKYRLLCYNCNSGRRLGPCPHESGIGWGTLLEMPSAC